MRVLRVGSIATVGLAVSAAAAAVAIGQAGPDKAAGLKAVGGHLEAEEHHPVHR